MLKIGSTGIKSLYIGGQKIKKAYVGDKLIFEDHIISSTLGKTWSQATGLPLPAYASSYNNLAFGNGVFLASTVPSKPSSAILKSSNGKTWSTISIGSSASYAGYVYFANGKFFYTRNKIASMRTSIDGISWTAVNMPSAPTTYWEIAGNNNQLLAIDSSGSGKCYRSTDGSSWSAGATAPAGLSGICYGDGMFLAISGRNCAAYLTRDHGSSWTSVGTGPKYPKNIIYVNNRFYATGPFKSYGVKEYTPKTNTWRDISIAMGDDNSSICGFAGDDKIILLLTNKCAHTSRDGGVTWTHTGLPTNKQRTNPVLGDGIFVAVDYTASEKASIWSA